MISHESSNTNVNYKITTSQYKNKLKVTFNYLIDVIFIPCITDYKNANLIDKIWWSNEDYRLFKNSAREEFIEFMKKNNRSYYGTSLRMLYQ